MAGHMQLEDRVRRLAGTYDATVPPTPALERRIKARLAIPASGQPSRPTLRRELGLAAALVLFVAAVSIGIADLRSRQAVHTNTANPAPSATLSSLPTPSPQIPAADLLAAGLTGDLVTPLDIQATDQGQAATLIGGYADPARIVVIVHVEASGFQRVDTAFSDQQGLINASTAGYRPLTTGDYVQAVESGPHPGADGLAHLTVTVTNWKPGNGPGQVQAQWTFLLTLPIHPATPVPAPAQFQLGRWKANIEVFEVTPAVVNLQALINGASVPEIGLTTVQLVDPAGNIVGQGCGASITVPKTQIDSPSSPLYHNARVYCEFPRPAQAGTYVMRFAGGGGTFAIPVLIKASAAPRDSVQ